MSNTLVTVDMVTRAALEIAHEKLTFLGTINKQFDSSFKGSPKIGDTLRIRMPNQYTRRTGSRVMDVQEQSEETQSLVVATQDGVDMRFNGAELTLSIEELSERYIEPAVSVLVAGVEGDVLEGVTKSVFNLVGSAGTVVGSSSGDISAITDARARLNQYLAPKDGKRSVQFDSVTMGAIVNGNKALFHDGGQIKEAFREGFISRNAMADWYENEKTYVHTNSSDVSGITVNSDTLVNGDTSCDITGASAAPAVGSVFTFATGNAVHPETKANYGRLQQFVVTASSTSSISFLPAIYSSGPKQNVSVMPGTTSALTWVGSASQSYRQNLMYHKDAFTFVTADLPIMAEAEKCVRRKKDNLSLRVWQGSDIRNDELLMRIDILYGYKAIRPEWACRITN